ncbi:MAG: carboxypeptidase-like regulatory domain-containing protein [Marinifilaceae bacterium]|jgi:protocatechuate 3,4-dioxygenase beta subunit|nr:carboxypeptidase-like regulatory domain-containing protein [Marinifilaceae bacterium]
MKKLVVLIGLIVSVTVLFATNKTEKIKNNKSKVKSENIVSKALLSGKVIDNETGESLTGVAIYIKELNKKVYTDFNGVFNFKNLKPGKYNIETDYISYKTNQIADMNLDSNSNYIKLELTKSK